MRITILLEPSADRTIPFAAGQERYQRLASELGRYSNAQVQIVSDLLRNVHADDYVLLAGTGDVSRSLADCGPKLALRLAPRVVLLDVSWQTALEQLERNRLAGAVDSLRLSEWLARPSSCVGPFGLRYLARPLGVSCVPLPAFRSARYCLLQSKRHRGMPDLLARYLGIYDRDQTPLSATKSVNLARARTISGGDISRKAPSTEDASIQMESVSTKRAIDNLRRARAFAGMTLANIAESSGVDPNLLGLLEGNEYHRAPLGALRAYALALEPIWGWTLADSDMPSASWAEVDEGRIETAKARRPIVESVIGREELPTQFTDTSSLPRVEPWVIEGRGMTFLGNHRIRRRSFGAEFERTIKEESNAGV